MTTTVAELPDGPKKEMFIRFEKLIGAALGVRHDFLDRFPWSHSSFVMALGTLLGYGALAIGCFWQLSPAGDAADEHAKLFSFTMWCGFYFAAGIVLTRYTTKRVRAIVWSDVLPFTSDDFAALAEEKLEELQAPLMFWLVPITATAVALGAAIWALQVELRLFDLALFPYFADVWFWFVTSIIFYYTAARAVVTATFPRAFALAFEKKPQPLYVLGAAESPLVQGLSKLNRTVLIYWTVMFFVILSVVVLVLLDEPFAFSIRSPLLSILIPVAGFFSLGVGSFVYIDSEATVRGALRRFTLARAKLVQDRINRLLREPGREPAKSVPLHKRLSELHDQILAGGRYGSRVGTTVSLVTPVAMLAIAVAEALSG